MTREEWYASSKFKILRLLNHMTFDIPQICQEIRDVLEVIDETNRLACFDKFWLVEHQLRIVRLEADKLVQRGSDLSEMLRPKKYDDDVKEEECQQLS